MKLIKCLLIFVVYKSSFAFAALKTVEISTQTVVPRTRWMYEGAQPNLKGTPLLMAKLKYAKLQNKYSDCISLADSLWGKSQSIRQWLLVNETECALNLPDKQKIAALKNVKAIYLKNLKWMLSGPAAASLKKLFIQAQLSQLDQEFAVKNPNVTQTVQELLQYKDWLTNAELSKLFKILGEMAFLKQDLKNAKEYYLRSLAEYEDTELRSKLNSIDELLIKAGKGPLKPTAPTEAPLIVTDETKIVDRMTGALKSGELLSAVQDGIELIKKFPGSVHSDWAFARISEVYSNLSAKTSDDYVPIKEKLVNLMGEADGKRIEQWANKAYSNGYYKDAALLGAQALTKLKLSGANTALTLSTAKSYLYCREFPNARELFKELVDKHSGTDSAMQGFFYLGLMEFIEKDYSKAISNFERLLALPGSDNYDLMTRYWMWRSLQNTDKQRATKEVEVILTKYPFTYYGLLAKGELNNKTIEFPNFKKKVQIKTKITMTELEFEIWERAKLLMSAGWYDEAQAELSTLQLPTDMESQILIARYFASTFAYPKAIELINKAWDENEQYRAEPFVEITFPREFSKLVKEQAQKNNLSHFLIWGLIKQESAFSPHAISRSGALGLMQIIPPTAKEIAGLLRLKNLRLPENMFDPNLNVRFGTYYLARLIKQRDGNVPLALASYNAGPSKIKAWMSSFNINPQYSSSPDYDVWIDLLPWSETRFYVKAILRNWIIYRVLEDGKFNLTDPIWSGSVIEAQAKNN